MKERFAVLALLSAAVAVSAVDASGARWWRTTSRVLARQPEAGAFRLASMPGWLPPEAIRRSRRLVERDLASAAPAIVVRALERLSVLQRRWFDTDPIGYRNGATAAMIDGRLEDASLALGEALLRDPTSALLYRLRALVSWEEGRREAALDDLAQASALAPTLRSPRLELTDEDASWVRREGLKRALVLYPRQRVRTLLALAEDLRSGGLEQEGRVLLEGEPYNPEIELAVATWDREAGRLADAAERLTRLANRRLVTTSLRARAWSDLAVVRALENEGEEAEAAARRALELAPGSTAPYIALAAIAEGRGDWAGALDALRRAWGLAPADPRMLVRVARAAERAGELSDARLALERAVELEPATPDHAVRLVDFLIRNGEFMDATLQLKRALDRFPTDPRLLRQLDRIQREIAQ